MKRLAAVLMSAALLSACGDSGRPPTAPIVPTPSPASAAATPTLIVFAEPDTGFSTSEVRDVQDQIVQFNTAHELIWTTDGTRLPGYRVASDYPGKIPQWKQVSRFCSRPMHAASELIARLTQTLTFRADIWSRTTT